LDGLGKTVSCLDLDSFRSEMNLKENYPDKLIKFSFSSKCTIKNFLNPPKSLKLEKRSYLDCNLTTLELASQGYKDKNLIKNISSFLF
jgi:hypothetical protein